MTDVIVIGGGAAGMMAAGTAAENGKSVLLLEKNHILGKKLLITGKGRCNVTNVADVQQMLRNITSNGRFLYSAFSKLDSGGVMRFFEDMEIPLKVERGGRVFPESDRSADIAAALKRYMKENRVEILEEEALELLIRDGAVYGVRAKSGNQYLADAVIIATGGLSYPATGSTGDGYRMAKEAGHEILPLYPALVPIEVKEAWIPKMQGLSLKNVKLTVYCEGKKVYSELGELLFTHFGVSGPLTLSASCHMREIERKTYVMSVDLKPALDEKTLEARVLRDFQKFSNKAFINALSELLPAKMIPVMVELSGIPPQKKVNQINKEERGELCYLLKNLEFTAKAFRPVAEAIVTAGGINTKEINPSTMESKLVKNLYFAGEVIDVDAYTGGYNLQIAFSTGRLAGLSC